MSVTTLSSWRNKHNGAHDIQLRVADWITAYAGSMNFVYLRILLFTIWMLFVERNPWPTLTLIVSLEAIFLSTFVMIGQNRQAAAGLGGSRLHRAGAGAQDQHRADPGDRPAHHRTAQPPARPQSVDQPGSPGQGLPQIETADQRRVRKAARNSSENSCGCSQAAKWPPLPASLK
jgi:hypothetical protein